MKKVHFESSRDYHAEAVRGRWQKTPIAFLVWTYSWPLLVAEEETVVLCLN